MLQKTIAHKFGESYRPPGANVIQRSYPSEYEDTFEEIPEAELEDEEETKMEHFDDLENDLRQGPIYDEGSTQSKQQQINAGLL